MDNLKYYNDSLAYDFTMFMPRPAEKRTEATIVKMPQKAKKQKAMQKAAARHLSVSAFAVLTAVFVLAALCGNIFLRLRINEVNSQINDIKTEISTLQSERTSLEVELERVISYSNIEFEATEIGMQKMDKDQVNYIRVNEENSATKKDGTVVVACNK